MKIIWNALTRVASSRPLHGLLIPLFFLALCHAADTPPRLFFSDAKLSFLVPEPWDVPSEFPRSSLLTRKTQEGTEADILCQVSAPVDAGRISADVSFDTLIKFATNDIQSRGPYVRIVATSTRTLVGQNAQEVTWISGQNPAILQHQSIYFFMESRFYVLTLRSERNSFPWIVQDFQTWLTTIHRLSREQSGQLAAPSHGGLWVHQAGGLKIGFPEDWLVGVADDHQVGATIARDKMHLEFTLGAEGFGEPAKEMPADAKAAARKVLEQKGYTITTATEDPFHGYPAYHLSYEGTIDGRFVRGEDTWVMSPKARWLINVEGDGAYFRQLSGQWHGILNGMQFYQ